MIGISIADIVHPQDISELATIFKTQGKDTEHGVCVCVWVCVCVGMCGEVCRAVKINLWLLSKDHKEIS